jgi:hypothetical protein
MARYTYICFTKATPGEEEAFHDWYDAQHLADCVNVPGVISAKRYRLLYGVGLGSVVKDSEFNSVALYELETDDPVAVAREMSARAGTEVMPLVSACDRDASVKYVAIAAREIGPDRDAPD